MASLIGKIASFVGNAAVNTANVVQQSGVIDLVQNASNASLPSLLGQATNSGFNAASAILDIRTESALNTMLRLHPNAPLGNRSVRLNGQLVQVSLPPLSASNTPARMNSRRNYLQRLASSTSAQSDLSKLSKIGSVAGLAFGAYKMYNAAQELQSQQRAAAAEAAAQPPAANEQPSLPVAQQQPPVNAVNQNAIPDGPGHSLIQPQQRPVTANVFCTNAQNLLRVRSIANDTEISWFINQQINTISPRAAHTLLSPEETRMHHRLNNLLDSQGYVRQIVRIQLLPRVPCQIPQPRTTSFSSPIIQKSNGEHSQHEVPDNRNDYKHSSATKDVKTPAPAQHKNPDCPSVPIDLPSAKQHPNVTVSDVPDSDCDDEEFPAPAEKSKVKPLPAKTPESPQGPRYYRISDFASSVSSTSSHVSPLIRKSEPQLPFPKPQYEPVLDNRNDCKHSHGAKDIKTSAQQKNPDNPSVPVDPPFSHQIRKPELQPQKSLPQSESISSTRKDANGRTLLHHAVLSQDASRCKSLLDAGCDRDTRDSQGFTPLHHAVNLRNTVLSKLLLDSGCARNVRDNRGQTPLHLIAGTSGKERLGQLLIDAGCDARIQDHEGKTPLSLDEDLGGSEFHPYSEDDDSLHKAVLSENFEACASLLLGGHRDAKDAAGFTALHYAVATGNELICALLLMYGCDRNVQNNIGSTPLHYAVDSENQKICKLLMSRDCDMTIRDIRGNTALEQVKNSDFEVLKDLNDPLNTNSMQPVHPLTLLNRILTLLDNPKIQENSELFGYLTNKERLLAADASDSLSEQDLILYHKLAHLLDENNNINPKIRDKLLPKDDRFAQSSRSAFVSPAKIHKTTTVPPSKMDGKQLPPTKNQKTLPSTVVSDFLQKKGLTPFLWAVIKKENEKVLAKLAEEGHNWEETDNFKQNFIHHAVISFNYDIALLARRPPYSTLLNQKDLEELTPLGRAVKLGSYDMCVWLLRAKDHIHKDTLLDSLKLAKTLDIARKHDTIQLLEDAWSLSTD